MASKNTPSAIVSGAYWSASFFEKVSRGLTDRGWDNERIHALVTQQGEAELGRGIDAFVDAIAGLPAPSFDPETGIYRFEVDYDQSIAEKTAEGERNPMSLAWVTDLATDQKFPDDRTGKVARTGRIKRFGKYMGQEEIERWAEENGKVLARPKELIDFSKAFPRPALDEEMPLAAPGQFWAHSDGSRCFLFLSRDGGKRDLFHVWLSPGGQWLGLWYFLVLDK